jgi:tetratricopeptide (TPR) repeat protein
MLPVLSLIQNPRKVIIRRPRRVLAAIGLLAVAAMMGLGGWAYIRVHYWEPRAEFCAAEAASQNRDFAKALLHLDRCLEAWPDDPASLLLAARTARRSGELDRAEQHLIDCQRVLAENPSVEVGDTRLEWALLQAQRGRLAEVENKLRTWLNEGHADSLFILETLSWELMMSGRIPEARPYLEDWLRRRPDDYEALVRRAWVAEHPPFDFPTAIDAYVRALSLEPQRDNVRLRLAELLIDQNQPKAALEHAQWLYEQRPGDTAVALCLARCHRMLGDFDAADELLAALPKTAQVLSERGLLAQQRDQMAQAERYLRQAATLDPHDRAINYNLSQCLTQLGKVKEAERYKQRVEHADEDIGRIGSLMRDVTKRPHDANLRYEIGTIFLRNGYLRDGEFWFSSAVRQNPGHRPSLRALTDYYERVGNAELAERYRQVLHQLDRDRPEAPAVPTH